MEEENYVNEYEGIVGSKREFCSTRAFNISDYSMFNGIMEASEEKNAPVIIAIHPDG